MSEETKTLIGQRTYRIALVAMALLGAMCLLGVMRDVTKTFEIIDTIKDGVVYVASALALRSAVKSGADAVVAKSKGEQCSEKQT